MYFGSVKFFKHVILTFLTLLILIPSMLSIFLYRESNIVKSKLDYYQSNNQDSNYILTLESILNSNYSYAESTVKANEDENKADGELTYVELLEYKNLYPELYVEAPNEYILDEMTLYLTFDDGPSWVTSAVLDILLEKDIKATFFVVYNKNQESEAILKRIIDEGHTIGIHSESHIYKEIYASVEEFLHDFKRVSDWVEETTGVKPDIFRFPGGSINQYNYRISNRLIGEMLRRGYSYFDWNISAEDANRSVSSESITKNIINGIEGKRMGIILIHDGSANKHIIESLGDIIDYSLGSGYQFKSLNNKVNPIRF